MAILTRELNDRTGAFSSALGEAPRLCYDTESRAFYVEHEPAEADPPTSGPSRARESVEGYGGEGMERLELLKAELLVEAGHAPPY